VPGQTITLDDGTRVRFASVKEWVNRRGGRLIYLGGNGLNCEIEYLEEGGMRCKSRIPGTGGTMSGRSEETGAFFFGTERGSLFSAFRGAIMNPSAPA